jgi:N-acetylneuraminate synthase
MATMGEVEHAIDIVNDAGCQDLTLLHCVSAYPTPTAEANLAAMAALRDYTGLPIGWSDHTNDPAVIQRAVHRWGASFVEMHLDIDGQGAEFAPGHCWLPDTAAAVIADIRRGIEADGHGRKEPAPSELTDRAWRADPSDGLRPMLVERDRWRDGEPTQP